VTTFENNTPGEAGRQALPRRRTDDLTVRMRLRRAAAGRSRAIRGVV
jgi:hypothetical protein